MKRLISLLLCLCLTGCAAVPEETQYTATFLELFDTVTTIVGRDTSEGSFRQKANAIRDDLQYYHRLFDIYNDYDVANIKTINDHAGISPVQVERPIIDLLLSCKEYYALTGGKVNAAMGSVLSLWHNARTDGIRDPQNATVPDANALEQAARHMDFDRVIIDEEASTVFITDPELRLDVGAVAKGWATQRVAENAPAGMLISVGGNVCATGPKKAGTPWVIGLQDPENSDRNLHSVYLTQGSVVTSGDYQRFYTVDGIRYHHIIDPQTRMPGGNFRAVSVICADSGLADALSTALFLMDLEEGMALAARCEAEALWVDLSGNEYQTPGLANILRN